MTSARAPRVQVHRVRVPFRAPVRTAAGTWTARDSWLIRLRGTRGRSGWGEVVLEDDADVAVLEALLDDLVASGLPPSDALLARAGAAGRAAQAALDAARLDLGEGVRGRGRRRHPPVGVNALIGAGDPAEVAVAAERSVAAGFRTLKLKVRRRDTTASLVERVAAVRAVVGDGVALRIDVNGSWDRATATERLRVLAGFDIQYVEQPLDPADVQGAVSLRAGSHVPIAADEAIVSVDAAREMLAAEAADVLVVKPARVGGPRAVAAIAAMAAREGVPVVISSLFETGVGLAAALACATALPDVEGWPSAARDHGLATVDLLEDDLLARPLVTSAGAVRAPGGAGTGILGMAVDEAALERYTTGRDRHA